MISIRKIIQKQYKCVSDFLKNEDFVLQFKYSCNELLEVNILYSDPVGKGLTHIYKFLFPQEEYLNNYSSEEEFKKHLSENPSYFDYSMGREDEN